MPQNARLARKQRKNILAAENATILVIKLNALVLRLAITMDGCTFEYGAKIYIREGRVYVHLLAWVWPTLAHAPDAAGPDLVKILSRILITISRISTLIVYTVFSSLFYLVCLIRRSENKHLT